MDGIIILIVTVCLINIVLLIFLLIKNQITLFNRTKIINAISHYNRTHDDIINCSLVMEKYDNTLYRLFWV